VSIRSRHLSFQAGLLKEKANIQKANNKQITMTNSSNHKRCETALFVIWKLFFEISFVRRHHGVS
jgi:hypothetical protein